MVKLSWWPRMRQPSLCQPPCPPTRLKFQQADTASEPRANRLRVMLTGVRSTRRDMPSNNAHICHENIFIGFLELRWMELGLIFLVLSHFQDSPIMAMITGVATLLLFPPSASWEELPVEGKNLPLRKPSRWSLYTVSSTCPATADWVKIDWGSCRDASTMVF